MGLLKNCGGIISVGKNGLFIQDGPSPAVLFCTAQRDQIQVRAPIVILSPEAGSFPSLILPDNSILLVDGQDRLAAAFAATLGLQVLDYGLSSRATLTLSSLSSEAAAVCLQRPVKSRKGNLLDPFEFPLHLKRSYPPDSLLRFAGILILSENWRSTENIIF